MTERGSESVGIGSVGIDLGTTYSSLAYVDRDGIPRMLCNAEGHSTIPSVIQFRDDGCVVGEPDPLCSVDIANLARFIKAHIGSDWRRLFRGQLHTSESLSAMILRALVDEAEPQIGPVNRAVITVPAYFTEKRRRATQHAGEIAGLDVIATLNEPMAATLAFCLNAKDQEQTVLVYDLGGGTFDVTIVRMTPAEVEELASNGMLDVGGRDWDAALIDLVAEDIERHQGRDPRDDPQLVERLRQICERAKRTLSRHAQVKVAIDACGDQHVVNVSRREFEDRTASLIRSTRLTAELALEDAGLTWSDLSRVILVGGASQMPAVREMLTAATEAPVDSSINPVTAVALGAAIYAHQLDAGRPIATTPIVTRTQPPPPEWSPGQDIEPTTSPEEASAANEDPNLAPTVIRIHTEDTSPPPGPGSASAEPPSVFTHAPRQVRFVTAHGVGVRLATPDGHRNEVVISRNTPVPAHASHVYMTAEPTHAETFIRVEITQGDTNRADLAELLGTGRIEGFPAGRPAGEQVRVSMEFDGSGRLHVGAVHLGSGKRMTLTLKIPGGLSRQEIQDQRDHLQDSPSLRVIRAANDWGGDPDDGDLDDDLSDLVEGLLD